MPIVVWLRLSSAGAGCVRLLHWRRRLNRAAKASVRRNLCPQSKGSFARGDHCSCGNQRALPWLEQSANSRGSTVGRQWRNEQTQRMDGIAAAACCARRSAASPALRRRHAHSAVLHIPFAGDSEGDPVCKARGEERADVSRNGDAGTVVEALAQSCRKRRGCALVRVLPPRSRHCAVEWAASESATRSDDDGTDRRG